MGMNRTGVIPGEKAARLYRRIVDSPMLEASGLHAYDGHFHESEFTVRQRHCNESFLDVTGLQKSLEAEGIDNITGPAKMSKIVMPYLFFGYLVFDTIKVWTNNTNNKYKRFFDNISFTQSFLPNKLVQLKLTYNSKYSSTFEYTPFR